MFRISRPIFRNDLIITPTEIYIEIYRENWKSTLHIKRNGRMGENCHGAICAVNDGAGDGRNTESYHDANFVVIGGSWDRHYTENWELSWYQLCVTGGRHWCHHKLS